MVRKIIIMCVAFTCLLASTHAHAENSTEVEVDNSVLNVVEYEEVEVDEDSTDVSMGDVIALYAEAVEAYNTSVEVYQGTINTTYLTIFRDIVSSLGINDDYVFFRSSDTSYSLLSGDLEYSSGLFTLADTGQLYTVTSVSGSYNYNSYYSYDVVEVSSYEVVVDDYLVYSNLGDFPTLVERGAGYEFATLFILFVALLCVVLRSVFSFCLRRRG